MLMQQKIVFEKYRTAFNSYCHLLHKDNVEYVPYNRKAQIRNIHFQHEASSFLSNYLRMNRVSHTNVQFVFNIQANHIRTGNLSNKKSIFVEKSLKKTYKLWKIGSE